MIKAWQLFDKVIQAWIWKLYFLSYVTVLFLLILRPPILFVTLWLSTAFSPMISRVGSHSRSISETSSLKEVNVDEVTSLSKPYFPWESCVKIIPGWVVGLNYKSRFLDKVAQIHQYAPPLTSHWMLKYMSMTRVWSDSLIETSSRIENTKCRLEMPSSLTRHGERQSVVQMMKKLFT